MEFKCNKEDCEEFDKIIKFTEVRVKYNKLTDSTEYYNTKTDHQLICPNCLEVLIEHKGEFQGFGVGRSTFNDKSPQQKREILKKREKEHQKGDKVFHEYKKFKDNGGKD